MKDWSESVSELMIGGWGGEGVKQLQKLSELPLVVSVHMSKYVTVLMLRMCYKWYH